MSKLVSSSAPKPAPLPPPAPVVEMPDPENNLAKKTTKRNAAVKASTSSRESTLLSQYGNPNGKATLS